MMYDLTNFTNATGLGDIMHFSNEVTNGGFMTTMVIALFFVILLIQKRYDMVDAMLSASFVCFVISAILSFGGLVALWVVLMFFLMLALGMLYKHFS